MNNPERKNATTPQTKAQEKLTDEQLKQLNAGTLVYYAGQNFTAVQVDNEGRNFARR